MGASTELSPFPVSSLLVQDIIIGQGQRWLLSKILRVYCVISGEFVAIYYCAVKVFMAFPLC